MGSGSAADIAKSNQISRAGWKGVQTLLSTGIHPVARSAAKKAVRTAARYILNTTGAEVVSGSISTAISKGTSWFADQIYRAYAAIG